MILFQSNGLVGQFSSPKCNFSYTKPFLFFLFLRERQVLKFTTLDQVKPSILSFIVCRSVCCPLLLTDQKWNYILSKRAIGSVLRKKKRQRHLTSRNIYAHVNFKNTSRNSHKRICSFVLFFALVLVPSIAQERFLNSESSLSCLQIFLIHWSLNMFCASAEVTHLRRCTKY